MDIDKLLRVVSNQNRADILDWLETRGEMSVTEINTGFDLSQSALSQHLRQMRDADVVQTRRASQTIYYRITDDPAIRELIGWRRRHYQGSC